MSVQPNPETGFTWPDIEPTSEMIRAYGDAWRSTPPGAPGDRTRAGLRAALKAMTDGWNEQIRAELDPDSLENKP